MANVIWFSIALGLLIFHIYCSCRIARRLGYDVLSGLLLAVPLLNLFIWGSWAMNESPTERKLRTLRAKVSREETPKIADALETAIGE